MSSACKLSMPGTGARAAETPLQEASLILEAGITAPQDASARSALPPLSSQHNISKSVDHSL